jgi:predicted Zn-dependent protease
MKKYLISLAVISLLLTSCGSVPITGRRQLNLVSDSEVLQSSLTQYEGFMKSASVSTDKVESEQVTRVGKKIAAATEAYLNANGLSSEVKNFSWEFNLVKSDEVNAFCMPGGKIVVYDGLLKLVSSDDELAVVLGHEVAHAVAKHSNERMSQQLLAQYGAQALSLATSGQSSA